MRFLYKALVLVALAALPMVVAAQGVTTASMSGRITDMKTNEGLIGATIQAVHEPSGSVFGNSGDLDGFYRIPGMRVGGPYKVTVSYTGYGSIEYTNIFLRLGENKVLNVEMEDAISELSIVEVIARVGTTGENAGTSTQISTDDIEAMPTLDRNLNDYVRLTPQATGTGGGGISFGGVNNRYNAIYIDGAVNNDVFGLAGSGTNGGQTGIAPFSIDIIDQLQVVLSPYDVTLGGFAGGGINAVTKSGTNTFSGTAYYFLQNDFLAGKTNGTLADRLGEDFERTSLDPFSQRTYGASLGGPIIKDKLFFFVNAEIQDDETPNPFEFGQYEGNASEADLNNLRNTLINDFGYDPGNFGNVTDNLEGLKFFGKLDYNINANHRLTLRHNYTRAEQFSRFASNDQRINFSNNGIFFPSITNSSAIELNSRFGNNASNNLIIGYTTVRDDRDPLGGDFPNVRINDGEGDIVFGSEAFSTANQVDQDILSITNNLKLYKGKHTFTLGTHNEFYSIYNVFIRQAFGAYRYSSIDAFLNDEGAFNYDRTYSLLEGDVSRDGSIAAADFNAIQLGFYAQDEWTISNKFTLTYGLRFDIPIITSDPNHPDDFQNTLDEISEFYPAAADVNVGSAPSGQLMLSPRVGFNYDLTNNSRIRGGVGIFTSRIPFVWPGAMFNNNGLTLGSVDENDLDEPIEFIADPDRQYIDPNFSVPSGQVDVFASDFRYPQVLRGNLAYETTVGNGWAVTLEGIYTKTLNNVFYTNINSDPEVGFNWTNTGADERPIFTRTDIDPQYLAIYLGENTNEGYTYNLTASVAKRFGKSLNATLAYTWGDAYAVNEGTSSQNSSQWRGQVNIDGRNNPIFGRSDFALGHRVIANLNLRLDWNDEGTLGTTIGLFYSGGTGNPYSFVIGDFGEGNGDNINNETGSTSRERSLVYVPANASEINLVPVTVGGETISPEEQWRRLDAFIEDNNHLSDRRGQYVEKNGSWSPFISNFDLSIRQDVGDILGTSSHRLQLSLDIFNVANLINNEWGTVYFNPGSDNNYRLYNFEGYAADGTTPTFSFTEENTGLDDFNIAGTASRWRARIGLRYIFN
ncbi:MAG: TonB-dependent receptor [Bacteroidota bacterium]